MKQLRRLFCLLLIAALLSSFGVCFAAQKDYSGYTCYVSLGDSIANGIGENNVANKYMHRTPGAYPDRIAQATGAYLTQLGCGGMRTVELRACLEPDYAMPDEYANNFTRAKVAEIRHFYKPAIAAADLITLNIGANDIATYALLRAKAALADAGVSLNAISMAVDDAPDDVSALGRLLGLAQNAGAYVNAVNAAVSGLAEGYARFVENWDAIIGDVYWLNPDVTLLVAGFYNPFNELKLSDSSLLKLGRAADGIIDAVNLFMQHGSAYAGDYIYVDITGIQSMAAKYGDSLTDEGFFRAVELDVHPSNEGQAEIAERFLAKLPEKSGPVFPFADVAQSRWSYPYVKALYDNGVVQGVTATQFDPQGRLTRGQLVTLIGRMAGVDAPQYSGSAFSDVPADAYFAPYVEWARQNGVAQGVGGGRFDPDAAATREQLAVITANDARQQGIALPAADEPKTFTDSAAISAWASDAVTQLQRAGVLGGYPDGTFRPQAAVTREEACKILCEAILYGL